MIPAVFAAVKVKPSSPERVNTPAPVDHVAAAALVNVNAPEEVVHEEAPLAVRVRAWDAPAAIMSAPPAGPVIEAEPSASTNVMSPTLENCIESVPSPTSRGAEGLVPTPIPKRLFESSQKRLGLSWARLPEESTKRIEPSVPEVTVVPMAAPPTEDQAEPLYPSKDVVVELKRNIPLAGVPGRSPVVPTGMIMESVAEI